MAKEISPADNATNMLSVKQKCIKEVMHFRIFLFFFFFIFTMPIYSQETFIVNKLKYEVIASDMVALAGGDVGSTLNIPEQISYEEKNYNVFMIADKAFYENNSIFYLNIPNSVKIIGKQAFDNCDNLFSVQFADNSVEQIRNSAFHSCDNLTSVTFPDGLKIIGEYAFGNCDELTTISFPNSLQSINKAAFVNCPLGIIYSYIKNPQLVSLPSADSYLNDAFRWRYFDGRSTYSACILQVPAGTLEKYKTANVWKKFEKIIEMESTSIKGISINKDDNDAWYNLHGIKIKGKPTEKGIYIKNRKKVSVK